MRSADRAVDGAHFNTPEKSLMLTDILIKIFIRDPENIQRPKVRLAYGILAGITGIAVNIILFLLKLTIGLLSGSIAIAADAANNLADAGSAVVTVVGFKLSAMPPDRDHPFGHGRVEYLAGAVVSVIIIVVGFTFFKDSIVRFFQRHELAVNSTMLIILGASLLLKVWLFFFYRKIGNKINSQVIKASAADSLSDTVCTTAVLAATIIGKNISFPLDAATGTIVAGLVIFAGIQLLRSTANPLLGECPSQEVVENLRHCLLQCDGIKGVHDIIIHNYGPNQYFATAHAEVDPDGTLFQVHDMLESAEIDVAKRMPIRLLLHCDPCNTKDPEVIKWRGKMEEIVSSHDCQLKLYDFRLKHTESGTLQLHFHLLVPRNYPEELENLHRKFTARIRETDPGVELVIEFIDCFV